MKKFISCIMFFFLFLFSGICNEKLKLAEYDNPILMSVVRINYDDGTTGHQFIIGCTNGRGACLALFTIKGKFFSDNDAKNFLKKIHLETYEYEMEYLDVNSLGDLMTAYITEFTGTWNLNFELVDIDTSSKFPIYDYYLKRTF